MLTLCTNRGPKLKVENKVANVENKVDIVVETLEYNPKLKVVSLSHTGTA